MWKGDRRALSAKTHILAVAFTCQENKSIDTLDSSNCLLWLPSQSFSQSHLNMGVLCVFGGGGGIYKDKDFREEYTYISREKTKSCGQLQQPALSVK